MDRGVSEPLLYDAIGKSSNGKVGAMCIRTMGRDREKVRGGYEVWTT